MSGIDTINRLDFANIIGGPLSAAVEAQRGSADATLAFILEVGFNPGSAPSSEETTELSRLVSVAAAKEKLAIGASDGETRKIVAVAARKNADDYKTYIKTKATGDVRYVSFHYDLARDDANGSKGQIKVPILTIVPIPYLSITSMDIDFSAKITEAYSYESKDSWHYGENYRSRSKRYYASYARQNSSEHSRTSNTEYDMKVHVHAENTDMPAGLSRILGVLESNVLSSEPPTP